MKKVTHIDSTGRNYKKVTDRYYCSGKLILEVEDSCTTADHMDSIVIGRIYYIVDSVTFYPEILVNDIELSLLHE